MRMERSRAAASIVLATGLAAGFGVATAQAAPLAPPYGSAMTRGEAPALVQEAAYRRCWISPAGVRHCRWVTDTYDEGYGYDDDYDYGGPVYGYGPGFFLGGGHRGHGFRGGGGHFGGGGGGHFGGGGGGHIGGGGHGGGHR
jgi:hypothetical protein